ncbi:MAG TPA: ATP-dependent DNA helicase RecG [Alphaproteobacteria bacterium]|nr:ATP-dependent DNA helicase RecG [Alphaproteobacteria bacterium]
MTTQSESPAGARPRTRPPELEPVFRPVTDLGGVGTHMSKMLVKVAGPEIVDLLWHLPVALLDRRYTPKIGELKQACLATLELTVDRHEPGRGRSPYRVRCRDETGFIELVFFNVRGPYLLKQLPIGEKRLVSGKVEFYNGLPQMAHPDAIMPVTARDRIAVVQAIYRLTGGLTAPMLERMMRTALVHTPSLPEWMDTGLKRKHQWPDWRAAILAVHNPQTEADLLPAAPARQRLAYDELLAHQLALALVREQNRRSGGKPNVGDGRLRNAALAALPYRLTGAQERSLGEILHDMGDTHRMLRLLQGDVGSGKTVVALLAMLAALETGRQAALMTPTEILARQHMATVAPICEKLRINVTVLTGRDKGKARRQTLEAIADGRIQIVIGTHALIQPDVIYHDLGLVVVDEQHRFGVDERATLTAKGQGVDTLVMSATPIPRSLTLAAYGDMDVSRLDEKPPGRTPIDTRLVAIERQDEVLSGLTRAIAGGARVYWVCPLIEESDESDMAAARQRFAMLGAYFGQRVGLVHGKMKAAEKDAVMAGFSAGDLDILVATTVIEVGVDVPEATIMVIEHAERFGLAQLHQLRGRVGRGSAASTCLLLYAGPLGETARQRLQTLRETEDGFLIAEEDLKLRGAGDLLGTKQSGMPDFKLADPVLHGDLLAVAADDARMVMTSDPGLTGKRGEALRTLLYLFRRERAVRYLRSG